MYGTYFECDWCGNKVFFPNLRIVTPPDGWLLIVRDNRWDMHLCKSCAEERLK